MVSVDASYFNLEQICRSGQCFRMRLLDTDKNAYEIIAANRRVVARQTTDHVELDCDTDEYESFWRDYFDIDTDYSMIRSMIDIRDTFLSDAAARGFGIRILRQDLWEMIVTFLISQQNNIPRIHKCVDNICEQYGERIDVDDGNDSFYAFPTPESLSVLQEDALMPCNLGYRSKYVVRAARAVADGSLDLDRLRSLDYAEARAELLKIYGIGVKVADCVCLFALHHLEAFPTDTHIKQVLEREYKDGFPFGRYERYLGVMQQYMFYAEIG